MKSSYCSTANLVKAYSKQDGKKIGTIISWLSGLVLVPFPLEKLSHKAIKWKKSDELTKMFFDTTFFSGDQGDSFVPNNFSG